jgi:hypothetical protein
MAHLNLALWWHSLMKKYHILVLLSGLLAVSGEENNLRHNDLPKSVAPMEKEATFDAGGKGIIVAPMEEEEDFETDSEGISVAPMEEEAAENRDRGITSCRII